MLRGEQNNTALAFSDEQLGGQAWAVSVSLNIDLITKMVMIAFIVHNLLSCTGTYVGMWNPHCLVHTHALVGVYTCTSLRVELILYAIDTSFSGLNKRVQEIFHLCNNSLYR